MPDTADAVTGTPTPVAEAPDPKRWLALAVIAVAQLMVILDSSIVNIALPSAQKALHISNADRQWMVTAYTLSFGSLLLLGGRIADYAGRKRIFVIGLIGFAGSSALGGLAVNAQMLFGARALQGAFGALLAPAALSLITVTFTEVKERSTAFGVYGAIAGGGAAIGLILGGVLTQYASWRWCLFVNVPIAVVTAVAALPIVRESRAHGNTSYDIPGTATVTGGLVSLVYGFTLAAQDGWTSSNTLFFLAVAVVLLASLWAGSYVLNFFGISLGALRVGGGLVVASQARVLLNEPDRSEARKEQQARPAGHVSDAAFYPLTMPLTTGPGTISVMIALAAERPSLGHGLLLFMLGMSLAALLISFSIWIFYRYADAVLRLLGSGGARVLARLIAFLLLCIGTQIVVNGVEDLAAEFLAGHH